MPATLGVRREDDRHERRAPLSPEQLRLVVAGDDIEAQVERSGHRIFGDAAYEAAGARLVGALEGCDLVLGVKEIPPHKILPGRAHCFFSHTIKGQPHNMPMLRRFLELGSTLIDYERVTDERGRRLIFFGRFAGLAGMVDSLWAYGLKLAEQGVVTPFAAMRRGADYGGLDEAKQAVREAGERIRRQGLPSEVVPFVCGFAGYGNVSLGAQEIFDLMPVRVLTPQELPRFAEAGDHSDRVVYKVIFKEEDMVEPVGSGTSFDLQEYYHHPERYRGRFETYLPHLSLLVNAIYWDPRYPRLVTKAWLRERYAATGRALQAIGDITCDVEGSIECTLEASGFEDPIYVYDPLSETIRYGAAGRGPVILALDRLPTEFPREAAAAFGETLAPFIPDLARADYGASFDRLRLPAEFRRAVIAHQGRLTPDYEYLGAHLGA